MKLIFHGVLCVLARGSECSPAKLEKIENRKSNICEIASLCYFLNLQHKFWLDGIELNMRMLKGESHE